MMVASESRVWRVFEGMRIRYPYSVDVLCRALHYGVNGTAQGFACLDVGTSAAGYLCVIDFGAARSVRREAQPCQQTIATSGCVAYPNSLDPVVSLARAYPRHGLLAP